MSGGGWLAWTVAAPLAGAILSLWLAPRAVPALGAVVLAITAIAAARVTALVLEQGTLRHALGGWGSPLGIELRADGLSAAMLLLFAAVGPLIVGHAFTSLEGPCRIRFLRICLFAWCALNGLVLSADLFNLYVTLELTTLCSVAALVACSKTRSADAALRYLLYALPGSLFYLLGVTLLYAGYGSLELSALSARLRAEPVAATALALMSVGLCLKTPLFPLHVWLPSAYGSAPAPVTALLSGLISKASFYILLRLWFEVFPSVIGVEAGQLVGWLGAAAVVWGSLLALAQKETKALVAYSSVAQIGYLFLAFPLGTPSAAAGAMYLVLSHATAKAAFFLAVGNVQRALGRDERGDLQGLAQQLPLSFTAMALGGISLIGVPPSGGFIAKFLLLRESVRTGQWWWSVVILSGGLLAAGYVMRVLRDGFSPPPPGTAFTRIPRTSELTALALALGALLLGLWPELPLRLLPAGGR